MTRDTYISAQQRPVPRSRYVRPVSVGSLSGIAAHDGWWRHTRSPGTAKGYWAENQERITFGTGKD
ncbi:hypothetical protein DPMN_002088 [Dreissena polymorpha]|uniref:Uncharacterized protein n=1 Tax=Dreissena polymorpha TaxID=45954 RepID=A0A9D4MMZ1_DREPO|nr:hypothetical protein DPMN_002088 [Dreissena polymorpha]